MSSQIDTTKPVSGNPTTQSVRDNFTTAANEITALQFDALGAPFLPLAGARMQGPMYLANDPTDAMMPATKGYVDAGGGSGGGGIPEAPADASTYGRHGGAWNPVLPIVGGTLTGALTLNADPSTALQAATKQYSDLKLPLAGGTLTGPLTLAANPSTALQAVPKQYADGLPFLPIGGGALTGPLTLAADPAAALQPSTKQYTDGAVATASASASDNVGRNLLHNSMFRVQQRGTGPWTVAGYTADRWLAAAGTAGGMRSYTINALGDPGRAGIGDEEAAFVLTNTFTGGSAAGDVDYTDQRIENVRRLAGKTVTISFWANCAAGTPKIGINASQNFGTGGSPSANVSALATGATVTISTTWARYSVAIPIPSAAGKTFGTTAGTDFTNINLFYSSGANNNAQAGNIGVQSGTVNLWGVQCEITPGAVGAGAPTPLEKIDPGEELRRCQRFFYASVVDCNQSPNTAGIYFTQMVFPPVQMRAVPTVAYSSTVYGNASGLVTLNPGVNYIKMGASATAVGSAYFTSNYTASADL